MGTKDPYVTIIKTIRDEGAKYNPPSIDIGVVLSSEPLVITIGDLQLTKENLFISDDLLKDYKRKFSVASTTATGIAGEHSISSIAIQNAELNYLDGLKKDDKVACLSTANGQTYIVLCRVV